MPRYRLRHQASNLELPIGEFTIGRSTTCHLSLDDGLVSRTHASLTADENGVVLRDLGSRNGVFLNGVKIEGATRVGHDDRITIGSHELVLTEVGRDRGDPSVAHCTKCEKPIPAGAQRCPHCHTRLRPFGATISNVTREINPGPLLGASPASKTSAPSKPLQEDETKHQVITIEFIARIADKALSLGKIEEAERILGAQLEAMLADRKEPIPTSSLRLGTKYALDLAEGLGRAKWLDWVFKVHQLASAVPEALTVDRLYQLVRKVKPYDARALRAYLESMAKATNDLSPGDRFLLRRLEGLERVIGA